MDPFATVAHVRVFRYILNRKVPQVSESQQTESEADQFDHNADRFPTWDRLLTRLLDAENVPEGQVRRLTIDCGAAGDITYRWYQGRDEESEFSYLGPAEG